MFTHTRLLQEIATYIIKIMFIYIYFSFKAVLNNHIDDRYA